MNEWATIHNVAFYTKWNGTTLHCDYSEITQQT